MSTGSGYMHNGFVKDGWLSGGKGLDTEFM